MTGATSLTGTTYPYGAPELIPGCRNNNMTGAASLTGTAYLYETPELIPGCRNSSMTGATSLTGTAYPVKLVAPVMLLFLQPRMSSDGP
jgi:hypothetical protein